jgi:hypothetical protein
LLNIYATATTGLVSAVLDVYALQGSIPVQLTWQMIKVYALHVELLIFLITLLASPTFEWQLLYLVYWAM